MILTLNDFTKVMNSVTCCYAKDTIPLLPLLSDFPEAVFEKDSVNLRKLEDSVGDTEDIYYQSLVWRVIGLYSLIKSRDCKDKPSINNIWPYISKSLSVLPAGATVSSIGSQGFLSIPLYKYDLEKSDFDFIRLHIWDRSLEKHFNQTLVDTFSIHTHSFYAESWVLCGTIENDRFKVEHSSQETSYALFTVQYNKTLNEINQHTSVAVNTGIFANVIHTSHELHMKDANYTVAAGDYHKSNAQTDKNITATLFSFTAANGLVDQSFVVGPGGIKESVINRKMHIDPTYFIQSINKSRRDD